MSRAFIISSNKFPVSRRALVFVGATLLLHVLALQSTHWKDWSGPARPGAEKIVSIQLRTEPPATVTAAPKHAPEQANTKAKIKRKFTATTESRQTGATAELVSSIEMPAEKTKFAAKENDEKLITTTAQETVIEEASQEFLPAPEPARYAVKAPVSVRIEMALVRTKPDASQNYGVASIDWTVNKDKYSMSIHAGLDLLLTSFNLYKLTSEGRLDQFGIAPEISTEARRTRASTATHFHREDKTISFSSSSKIVTMDDGAQDKASFLMQLASIGYADEKQFFAGKEFEMQVAEERDAALFHFLVLGKEEINTKLGKISAWHLLRAPRPGSYNSQLDIWLAPEFGWYPVQIRNTESNGTVTEQTATKVAQKLNAES